MHKQVIYNQKLQLKVKMSSRYEQRRNSHEIMEHLH